VERKRCAMILVSHDIHAIRNFCSRAIVLKSGRARVFDDIELALSIYQSL
jgi:capsular polysaccharide transport system ATP-binding protein